MSSNIETLRAANTEAKRLLALAAEALNTTPLYEFDALELAKATHADAVIAAGAAAAELAEAERQADAAARAAAELAAAEAAAAKEAARVERRDQLDEQLQTLNDEFVALAIGAAPDIVDLIAQLVEHHRALGVAHDELTRRFAFVTAAAAERGELAPKVTAAPFGAVRLHVAAERRRLGVNSDRARRLAGGPAPDAEPDEFLTAGLVATGLEPLRKAIFDSARRWWPVDEQIAALLAGVFEARARAILEAQKDQSNSEGRIQALVADWRIEDAQ